MSPTTTAAGSAVVTGAGRGIGRAVAQRLVQRGYAVVVTDVDGDSARRTAEEIGAVAGVRQDVREEDSHTEVARAAGEHGPLAVWVNNAGVGDDGTLAELDSAAIDRLVEVNLRGTIWGMRAALAGFGEGSDVGDIINVASLSGLGPVPGLAVYAATKAAVVSLTASVAAETPRRVRVHAVLPDGVDTDMVAGMRPGGSAKALVHSGGRLLSVDEVARAAVGMIGSRRVLRTVPAWRGGLMRAGALAPSGSAGLFPVMAALGRRVMTRSNTRS
ncbi:MAG TPA: SDR family oxidoreductase [Nocardioidaceae bacterium]|nr:SDR family oxidoreductase [Nocardioidaceae bacterium]